MNEVATIPQHALTYTPKQLDLIRKTVAADCSPTEFDLFCEVARRVGLDPFRKQIYAVVYSKDNAEKRRMSIITGIDGYRAIASRNRDYRPDTEAPSIEYDAALKSETNPAGIVSATVKCFKLASDNLWHPVVGIAYWEEFAPLREKWAYDKTTNKRAPTGEMELDPKSNWYRMPRVMISKCAEAQALRRGWSEDLSGLYAEEEMDRARVLDMTASEAADTFEREKRLQITGGKDSIFVQWTPSEPLESVPLGKFGDRAAEFVNKCASLPDLIGWEETNRVALVDFWARAKPDALELKKIIEARKTALGQSNKKTAPAADDAA